LCDAQLFVSELDISRGSSEVDEDWLKREDFIQIDISITAEINVEIINRAPIIHSAIMVV
jgi:hypothetical protein